ncbi:MAG: cytochrome b/b6 domain-containing protein [Proteobacteria bacterium]|nr:cytochrome b/b6 domain-containing protein [Pseudomonadota bacterium]MDA1285830.1 cytochrome b/b6 domain-containing protein [Pseudomonadota bacterium]
MSQHSIQQPKTLVWDIAVRVFHWALVGAVLLAFVTADLFGATWLTYHIWAGASAAGLVVARLIWGVTGSTYARLASFVTGPRETLRHLRDLVTGRAPRHLGHNPLGGWMILGLIAVVLGLAASGVAQLGGIFKTGPLGFAVSYATGEQLSELHEVFANLLLILIGLHIIGALFESWRTRENLPLAMVTGKKERRNGDHQVSQAKAMPWLAALLVATALGGAIWGARQLTARPAFGAAVAVLDPTYAAECSECHQAFNPSLMTAANWVLLMQALPDHFSEDASLDDQKQKQLTDWLVQNAADTADTKASHRLRATDPATPYTLTKTQFWTSKHRDIADETFKRAPIFSRSNCSACHRDAESGQFFPPNATLPNEVK